MLDTVV